LSGAASKGWRERAWRSAAGVGNVDEDATVRSSTGPAQGRHQGFAAFEIDFQLQVSVQAAPSVLGAGSLVRTAVVAGEEFVAVGDQRDLFAPALRRLPWPPGPRGCLHRSNSSWRFVLFESLFFTNS
jgi:hypothetical protein